MGNKNKLMPEHIEKIATTVNERSEEEYFSKLVPIADIEAPESHCNLSVGTWVEKRDTRVKVDIAELNERIAGIVEREAALRAQIDAIVAELEG